MNRAISGGGKRKLGKWENVGWKNWGMGEEGNWRMAERGWIHVKLGSKINKVARVTVKVGYVNSKGIKRMTKTMKRRDTG